MLSCYPYAYRMVTEQKVLQGAQNRHKYLVPPSEVCHYTLENPLLPTSVFFSILFLCNFFLMIWSPTFHCYSDMKGSWGGWGRRETAIRFFLIKKNHSIGTTVSAKSQRFPRDEHWSKSLFPSRALPVFATRIFFLNKHCFKSKRVSIGLETCLKGQIEVLQAVSIKLQKWKRHLWPTQGLSDGTGFTRLCLAEQGGLCHNRH